MTEDERALVTHVTRWGSDGYPVHKVGSRHWTWDFRSIAGPPVLFKTKREAVASFERFMEVLHEALREEAQARAVAEVRDRWLGKACIISDGPERGTVVTVSDVEPHPTRGWLLPMLVTATGLVPSNLVEVLSPSRVDFS